MENGLKVDKLCIDKSKCYLSKNKIRTYNRKFVLLVLTLLYSRLLSKNAN